MKKSSSTALSMDEQHHPPMGGRKGTWVFVFIIIISITIAIWFYGFAFNSTFLEKFISISIISFWLICVFGGLSIALSELFQLIRDTRKKNSLTLKKNEVHLD